MEPKVIAVIPTFGRPAELERCLASISRQSRPVETTVVVFNGTDQYAWEQTRQVTQRIGFTIVRTAPNIGCSNAYAIGIEHALRSGADYVWLVDDDGWVHTDALRELVEIAIAHGSSFTAPSGRIVTADGHTQSEGTPIQRRPTGAQHVQAGQSVFGVHCAVYHGLLVSADAIRLAGLPDARFFVYVCDYEWTWRLSRSRLGAYAAKAISMHPSKPLPRELRSIAASTTARTEWYFKLRNSLYLTIHRADLRWLFPRMMQARRLANIYRQLAFDFRTARRLLPLVNSAVWQAVTGKLGRPDLLNTG